MACIMREKISVKIELPLSKLLDNDGRVILIAIQEAI